MAPFHSRCSARYVSWAGVAVMVAVAVLSMAQWAEGAFPGRNGRIAMGASWLGCEQGRIATIKPDGTGFRALTRCGEGAPEWFADGRRLLFTAKAGLSVMAADGSHRRVLPPGVRFEAIDQPSIAPDGRHLTFLGPTSNPDPYAPDARPQVWRVAFDGTHRRAIGEGYSPRWSPNGRRIAFESMRDGNLEVYVMNADGSSQTRVTNHPALDALPSFSQNSKQIVFVSDRIRKGQRRLFVANVNGSGVRMLSRGTFDMSPDWARG